MKVAYACVLIIICTLLTTGFLSDKHALESNIVQTTSSQGDNAGTLSPTPSILDYQGNFDNTNSSQIFNNQDSPQNITLITETNNSVEHIDIGVNYLSIYHLYSPKYTTDTILNRDFSKFQRDGIKTISLALYWYRLEGDTQGSFNGTNYGDSFLDNIKHVISVANQHNLKVFINFNTLWENDSLWCTPKYVIDPITNQNDGLAIVRSPGIQQAFIEMFNHTIRYLAGTPGIAAWAILNEPWYWGRTANEHDFITANGKTQKENFIDVMQQLSTIVKQYDGRPVTVKFPSSAKWTGIDGLEHLKDIFVDDWNWDQRIFNTLDFISFDNYIPSASYLESTWRNITTNDVTGCYLRNKEVWIAEFGFDGTDDNIQVINFNKSIQLYESLPIAFVSSWCWEGDNNLSDTFGYGGTGMNLCADGGSGTSRNAYQQLISFKSSIN